MTGSDNSRSAHAFMERGAGNAQLTGESGLRGPLIDQTQQGSAEALTGLDVIPIQALGGTSQGPGLGRGEVTLSTRHVADDTSGPDLTQPLGSVRVRPDGIEKEREMQALTERQREALKIIVDGAAPNGSFELGISSGVPRQWDGLVARGLVEVVTKRCECCGHVEHAGRVTDMGFQAAAGIR
jgi:hypothetical protein